MRYGDIMKAVAHINQENSLNETGVHLSADTYICLQCLRHIRQLYLREMGCDGYIFDVQSLIEEMNQQEII